MNQLKILIVDTVFRLQMFVFFNTSTSIHDNPAFR